MEHIWFGTMNGPDGKPFKTREGGVVRLSDVIQLLTDAARRRLDEAHLAENYPAEERDRIAALVGVAALKFGDLINNRVSDYIFDIDRFSSFEGKTGPYLQYAAVRIKSILRRGGGSRPRPGVTHSPLSGRGARPGPRPAPLPRGRSEGDRSAGARTIWPTSPMASPVGSTASTTAATSSPNPTLPGRAHGLHCLGWALDVLNRLLDLLGIEIPDRM